MSNKSGQGNAGGWPSTTGNKSGDGRSNNSSRSSQSNGASLSSGASKSAGSQRNNLQKIRIKILGTTIYYAGKSNKQFLILFTHISRYSVI